MNKLLVNKVVNKVAYSRVSIFLKKTGFFFKFVWEHKITSFSKFTWEYEVISFSEIELQLKSLKIMVNKCLERNCSTSYKTRQRKASFHFHEDQELKRKCIYFDHRKDWLPNAHSVICIEF